MLRIGRAGLRINVARGYIQRGPSERTTKRASTQVGEKKKAQALIQHLDKYSLAALSAEVVAQHRDTRLANEEGADGKRIPRSNDAVRLELALLSPLFTVAIKERGIGLPLDPVANIRCPAPAAGRIRRLTSTENKRLLAAAALYSSPMFGGIVRIALETGVGLSDIAGLRLSPS